MSDPNRDLQREAEAAANLRVLLGDVIEHDSDPAWEHALEGQCEFYETLERVCEAMLRDEADIEALKGIIGRHQSRKTRLEARVERARKAVRDALRQAHLKNARVPSATISFGKTYRVDITNSERLPPEFLRQRPPEPDREKIKAKLKAGEDVPGAELVETQSVRVNFT